MKLLASLFSGVWGYVAAGGAILAAILTFGASQKRNGRKVESKLQERIDNENANDIRDRVDGVKPMRDDDLKFRDG